MQTKNLVILIVEDDATVRVALADGMAVDGHGVVTAQSCRQARTQLAAGQVDLVLLDLNLPDDSGYKLLRDIRGGRGLKGTIDPDLPVIVLSGRASEVDRLRAFEQGCDDFLVKPYSFAELRGRIGAVARRSSVSARRKVLTVGELQIDLRARSVLLGSAPVTLTGKEYALLVQLASDPLRVFTKAELLLAVWGHRDSGSTRTLDSHACRLRRKLSGGSQRMIVNIWGAGYRLCDGNPTEGNE
ncbi:MAG: response regulator transcription factor [Thermoleophilaceae bacterium]|nr:response regulator transcription factor [Thermoleophilaceae bacterium]